MGVELPIVSFISALLTLIPLPWHWRTRNVCTASIMLWLAVSNIFSGVNAVIWSDNVDVKYEIWCDIFIKIQVGGNVGVPACVLCICRRLAHACSPYRGALSVKDKRQRMKFEIGMCVVLPILVMPLHVIVQIYRFELTEGIGCLVVLSRSFPTLLIFAIPPLLLSIASMVYAGVALHWLIHRRAQFLQASPYTSPVPASSPYIRAVALAVTQMTVALVMSLILASITLEHGVHPWTSWEYIHENWREIHTVRKAALSELFWRRLMVTSYFVPIASVTVFAYFGFDDRVAAEYRRMFTWIQMHIFRTQVKRNVLLSLRNILKTNNAITDVVETDDPSNSHSINLG